MFLKSDIIIMFKIDIGIIELIIELQAVKGVTVDSSCQVLNR